MTLFKQLMITIIAIFSLMLIVVMGINFNTTKVYLVNQLELTTQDSATSLSMSISDFMGEQDYVSVDSNVQAVFDSGYFSAVKVHIYETDTYIKRVNSNQVVGVPEWFLNLVEFDEPVASAVISNGWNELGQVYVTGSAGYGYYQLWLATRDLVISFVIIGSLSLLIGTVALRQLFKPLAAVEAQAEAIQQRNFVKMDYVPKTRELRSVVLSMNRMAEKLEKEFAAEAETAQWLQAKAFKDPVSGLGNRNFYESQATAHFVESDRTMDGLILISLFDLAKLNNERGYEAADTFIKQAAEILTEHVKWSISSTIVARMSGADFVILMSHIDLERLETTVANIMESLKELVAIRVPYSESVANIGAVLLDSTADKSKAMAEADAALRAAKAIGSNGVKVFDIDTGQHMAIGRIEWKKMLDFAIEHKSFRLRKQRVTELSNQEHILQKEVFASLEYQGQQYHAGYFIGLAEQFDLGDKVDQVIINMVIDYVALHRPQVPLVINLSASAYIKPAFVSWLDSRLKELSKEIKEKMSFEVSEQSVLSTEDHAFLLVQVIKKHNVTFGIDNVGKQFSAFQYLQKLMPDYVKVDPSYTKLAVGKQSESFFMHTLCKMFNSLNIQVIATGVESSKQLEILQRFDIYGAQGFILGRAEDM
ncbi:EAL domain-containing protein [Marinomonas sp. 15G1-11]|uniref:EAL domain-containing protein n=1 Tax=Marinomonas phaeophyticola TaxID=3004091 RepID=A0ABT4JYD3_9GAMM|nr:EAL domain-containing protein [Marinomonas sp. 15G1-11]MCZ2723398.1 EAL domain-containing protein [Marinomonas sp. 15G1-11]